MDASQRKQLRALRSELCGLLTAEIDVTEYVFVCGSQVFNGFADLSREDRDKISAEIERIGRLLDQDARDRKRRPQKPVNTSPQRSSKSKASPEIRCPNPTPQDDDIRSPDEPRNQGRGPRKAPESSKPVAAPDQRRRPHDGGAAGKAKADHSPVFRKPGRRTAAA